MSAHGGSTKVILVSLVANIGIAAAKLAGALISGSASLLAEGIHTLVDCANQVLLLFGEKRAKLPPTKQHPLGHGKEAFFWSFIVAILLFSLGGLFAIYEGLHKFAHPEPLESPLLGLGILAFSGVLEGYSFWECVKEIHAQNPGQGLWNWFRTTTSADLLVVFTENGAAIVGLVFAAIAMSYSWYTGNGEWDALGSVFVGAVLVIVSVLLATEIKSLMIGEAPATDFREFILKQMQLRIPGSKLFNLIAIQIGPGQVMISAKLTPGNISGTGELIDALNLLETDIKGKFPEVVWLFVEPDNKD